jgi:hypothetical protein
MKLKFDNNFQQKVMVQTFEEPTVVASKQDVQQWRSTWMQELKSWHSPYKAIIDCSQLDYRPNDQTTKELELMIKFFEGLFLRSVAGFGFSESLGHQHLPFKVVNTFEDAQELISVRGISKAQSKGDFRSLIQIQNHFAQHVIELNFSEPVVIDSAEKLEIFKSKITNNLMQWHSKWSLLIDCTNLEFAADQKNNWSKIEKYFKSFFMKAVLGYSPNIETRDLYPFETYRARHAAVAKLESEGNFMGNDAQCRSKSPSK